MKILPVVAAAGVVTLSLSPSPVHALSAGILQQSSNRVSLLVGNRGTPTEVKIVAIDREYNELDGVITFPETFLAGTQPRRVTARIPDGTWAVCAKEVNPLDLPGASLTRKTCSMIDSTKLGNKGLNFSPSRTGVRIQRVFQHGN